MCVYTLGNILLILAHLTEISLYLSFSNLFDTARNSAWFEIYRKRVIPIQIWFDLTRFRREMLCTLPTRKDYEQEPSLFFERVRRFGGLLGG